MPLIRLTPEIADGLEKTMGISPAKIREAINAGTMKGQKITDRIYMIDDSYLPKSEVPVVPAPVVLPDEDSAEVDRLIAYTEKQKELTSKYIQLKEIRGLRDLPEKLKALEVSLKERERIVSEKEINLTQKDTELKDIAATLDIEKLAVSQGCAEQVEEVNEILKERNGELTELQDRIEKAQVTLDGLNSKVSQAKEVLQPYVDLVKHMIGAVEKRAAKHYQVSEKSDDEAADWHLQKANKAWSLSDKLQKVLGWLTS